MAILYMHLKRKITSKKVKCENFKLENLNLFLRIQNVSNKILTALL